MMRAWREYRHRREQRVELTILACLLYGDESYGDIQRRTGLGKGSVYSALYRLEGQGLVRSAWDFAPGPEIFKSCHYWLSADVRKLLRGLREGAE